MGGPQISQTITPIILQLAQIINILIPLMIALAIVYFFWGLVKYIREPEHKEGIKIMTAGIISLFVMVSIWGIIAFAGYTLGINTNNQTPLQAPRVAQ